MSITSNKQVRVDCVMFPQFNVEYGITSGSISACSTARAHITATAENHLYSHIAQLRKQSEHLKSALHMVDKERDFILLMELTNPSPLTLPIPKITHSQRLPSARNNPYRTPKQRPTAPMAAKMTWRYCTTFTYGVEAIEHEMKCIQELFTRLTNTYQKARPVILCTI